MPIVTMPDGSRHRVTRLLSPGHSNHKQAKGEVLHPEYLPVNLALAPHAISGRNVCPLHTAGCSRGCLYHSGRGQLVSIRRARIARTMLYHQDRPLFLRLLHRELREWRRKARREGRTLAARLNVFSDLAWERIDPTIFTSYPEAQFYDYTKRPGRLTSPRPANYHLTFSRSESNLDDCLALLGRGFNVTAVFRRRLPGSWHGHPNIDGDRHDYRFLDPSPRVVGLVAKGKPGKGDRTGFVVR